MLGHTFLSVCMDSCACACVSHCLYPGFVWTLLVALAFLSGCIDSCACVSHCLYQLFWLRLHFSVVVLTLVLALAFLLVCMDSSVCACVS